MKPRAPRPDPRLLAGSAATSCLLGAVLVGLGPVAHPTRLWPSSPNPATVAGALARGLPASAQPRVDGLWGSATHGRWQFTGYVSYLGADGRVHGRLVTDPSVGPAGGGPTFSPARLALEQRLGWPVTRLADVLRRLRPDPAASAAAVVVETVAGRPDTVVYCTGAGSARCERLAPSGAVLARFPATLVSGAGGLVYPQPG